MNYKYLHLIPKPLLDDFVNNRVIPFVGAGFSKNADIPEGLTMPDWNELGEIAASEINDYTYDNNTIDALSYYEDLYSRTKLVELLMKSLHHGRVRPSETHRAFCELFSGIICTTNYDSLLEDELTLLNRPVSVVVTKDRLTVESKNESKIIKLHGDFNHPEKMIITENDYDMYVENNPIFCTYIANLFITNTMLLVGYSLDDDDFRNIWKVISSRLGNMSQPAYCIAVGMSKEKIDRYKRRNIRVINITDDSQPYKTILRDFFSEITDYVYKERDRSIKSSSKRINDQMNIPADNNRLCFVSCSMSRIEQLSSFLYPILNNMGVIPVRIDNLLMPDDNWMDIATTAIRKSKGAIVDISDYNPNVMFELGIIQSQMKKNLLILCDKNQYPPSVIAGYRYLSYSSDTIFDQDETEKIAKAITKWADDVYFLHAENANISFCEAHRLFDKQEYSACIISAYSELELFITLNYEDKYTKKYGPLHAIFRFAEKASGNNLSNSVPGDYHSPSYNIAKEFIALRNRIVHQQYKATKEEASEFLRFAEIIKQEATSKL